MTWESIDWKSLDRLRTAFLAGTAGADDYWRSEADVASYDATFAQRIGWKWDYVLAELQRRGWSPAPGTLLDWGCGSGIAHRAFLDFFGVNGVSKLTLWDRSPLAMRFAERRAKEKYPGLNASSTIGAPIARELPVRLGPATSDPASSVTQQKPAGSETSAPLNQTLLLSHVLTELTSVQLDALADFAASFTTVIWVEPGTYDASRALIAVRERLRSMFNVIAPCTHQAKCGMLAPGNESHWCHHFASPPPEIFMDRNWAKFGEIAGVDLRSLPLSFLVLDRRPARTLPTGATRVIGHPRLYKPYALLLGCDESGVAERRLTKRTHPDDWRTLKRGDGVPLQVWRCDGDEIVEARPL